MRSLRTVRRPMLRGHGAYQYVAGSLGTGSVSGASFANGPAHVVYKRVEFVQDVISSTGFSIQDFSINPGNDDLFPWLATNAQNFDEWELGGLVVTYRPTCGSAFASANNAMGTVILATRYNALAPSFTSKQQMENYEFANSGKPDQQITHCVEAKRGENPLKTLYVRPNDLNVANSDRRLYDLGIFSLATVGMQTAGVTIGELRVAYHIILKKPRLAQSWLYPDEVRFAPPGVTNAAFWGNGTLTTLPATNGQYGMLKPSFFSVAGNVMTIRGVPIGTPMLMSWYVYGNSQTIGDINASISLSGATTLSTLNNTTTYIVSVPAAGVTTQRMYVEYAFTTTAETVTLTAATITIPDTNTVREIRFRVLQV